MSKAPLKALSMVHPVNITGFIHSQGTQTCLVLTRAVEAESEIWVPVPQTYFFGASELHT